MLTFWIFQVSREVDENAKRSLDSIEKDKDLQEELRKIIQSKKGKHSALF